jgi:hypothetical protein
MRMPSQTRKPEPFLDTRRLRRKNEDFLECYAVSQVRETRPKRSCAECIQEPV